MGIMRRVCSYCGKELGAAVDCSGKFEGEMISHGICRGCLERALDGEGQSMDEFLDSIDAPIFVVDSNGRMLGSNQNAKGMVGKDAEHIVGELGGDVFGCAYADLPGGCGGTVHCQSCVIRNTVMKTYETGEPQIKVPACQDLDTIEGERTIRFLISTEKTGDAVLLRIDDAQPVDE